MFKSLGSVAIRTATERDHPAIMQVAKQTPWTQGFGNQVMFSSPQNYSRGWILVAEEDAEGVVGFACYRPKVRTPETMLYFIGVDPQWSGQGIGWALIEQMMDQAVPRKLALKCAKDNPDAKGFYDKHQFKVAKEDAGFWYLQRVFK